MGRRGQSCVEKSGARVWTIEVEMLLRVEERWRRLLQSWARSHLGIYSQPSARGGVLSRETGPVPEHRCR